MNRYQQSCAEVVDREVAYWRQQQRAMQQQGQRLVDWERRQAEATRIAEPVPTEAPVLSRPGWRDRVRAQLKRLWQAVKGKFQWWRSRTRTRVN